MSCSFRRWTFHNDAQTGQYRSEDYAWGWSAHSDDDLCSVCPPKAITLKPLFGPCAVRLRRRPGSLASLGCAPSEFLHFLGACKAQLLDCRGHAVMGGLRVVF